jgi:ATP-dependent protease Clp ATPase subunit
MYRFRRLRCSFCGKNNNQVVKLVAGPRAFICDKCVAIASRIMADDSHGDGPPARVEPAIWQKLSARVRSWITSRDARRVSFS